MTTVTYVQNGGPSFGGKMADLYLNKNGDLYNWSKSERPLSGGKMVVSLYYCIRDCGPLPEDSRWRNITWTEDGEVLPGF